jgi:NAD(P)-dependent dehydrogenase (short-subunit alcohol dehydrogenase family)
MPADTTNISGKVVVITGASSGLGEATARYLAVAELTIKGNRAEVRVLQEGLTGATGVTVVGNTAFVLVERAKAVGVPYPPR